jgi:ABC-2 type transport system permease protein
MIATLAQHECKLLWKSGKLLHLLAFCQGLLAFIAYWLLEEFYTKSQRSLLEQDTFVDITEAVLHPLFAWTVLLFFFITPLLAVSTFTQERKTHTLTLYLSAPIEAYTLVMGKFLGTFMAQCFLLLPILGISLLLALQHTLDGGQLLCSYIGLFLFLGAVLSIAIGVASCCREPLIATFLSFSVLLGFSLLEWVGRLVDPSAHYFAHFSLIYHCKNFLSGILSSQDLIYYILVIISSLAFSIMRFKHESFFER